MRYAARYHASVPHYQEVLDFVVAEGQFVPDLVFGEVVHIVGYEPVAGFGFWTGGEKAEEIGYSSNYPVGQGFVPFIKEGDQE